ncbi:hypothetical protein R3P38DRAFT_3515439 [Favolaschia claudopus]|uniref:Peptidase M12A domain-containing protein n=1 Tax=Favolaschia claudopus TaxID=2862362 RepID=A0AAV9YZV0_9AGAR
MSFIAQWKTCGLAPSTALLQQSQKNSTAATSASHAVVTRLDQLWDAGSTVTYSFLGGTANQQAKVDKVVLECYDTTMNLGWISNDTNITADDRAVILHEFGHVLGLLHEHQSPARGGTLHLDENAVYAYYAMTQGWNKAMIKSQIIDVYDTNDVSNYSALDMKSIMMYFMPAAMDKERIEIKPNNVLSELDKAYMVINYPRAKPHPSAPEWTLAYALKVAGVSGAAAKDMLALGSDAPSLRSLFTAAQISARIKAKGGN